MKKHLWLPHLTVFCLVSLFAQQSMAASPKEMRLGGYYHNGFALVAGHGYEEWPRVDPLVDESNRTPKFAVGGGIYFDFFLNNYIGIEGGFGLSTKGIRFSRDEYRHKLTQVYFEIPIMAKFEFKRFQAAAGLALFVALGGRSTIKYSDDDKNVHGFNDTDWRYRHRVNVGPKIALGYAIPVGPIALVPGLSWTIHLANDLDSDEIKADTLRINEPDYKMRFTNLMFVIGVEWRIPK